MTTNNHVRALQFSKEVRLPKLVEMLNGGATLQQYAEAVGVNYRTAIRDKQEVRGLLKVQFSDSVEEYRLTQLEELGGLREELLALKEKAKGINDPETQIQLLGALIEQGLKILDREMRLIGTDKPGQKFGSLPPGEDGVVTAINVRFYDGPNPNENQLPPGQVVKELPAALEDELPEELKLP
jgi:hypothetical protein